MLVVQSLSLLVCANTLLKSIYTTAQFFLFIFFFFLLCVYALLNTRNELSMDLHKFSINSSWHWISVFLNICSSDVFFASHCSSLPQVKGNVCICLLHKTSILINNYRVYRFQWDFFLLCIREWKIIFFLKQSLKKVNHITDYYSQSKCTYYKV